MGKYPKIKKHLEMEKRNNYIKGKLLLYNGNIYIKSINLYLRKNL